MNRQHATSTTVQQGPILTYEKAMRDPQLMERLIRDAHHARNEAIYRALAAAVHAIGTKARRAGRAAKVIVLRAEQHAHAALAQSGPPGRRC